MLVFTSVCQKHGLASTEYVIFIFQKIRFVEARLSEVAPFGNVRFAEAKRSKTKRTIILSSVWGGGRHFISRSSPFAVSLSLDFKENRHTLFCWRPCRVECTGSLLTSEVKRHRARLVLGWGTAWEHLRVLPAFSKGIKLMLVISACASARACARVCACACARALARARVRACVRVCVRALRYVLNEQSL